MSKRERVFAMYLLMRTGVTDPSYKAPGSQGTGVTDPSYKAPGSQGFLATWFSRWQPVGVGCWTLDAGRWMLGILVCSLQSTVCSLLFLVFGFQSSVIGLSPSPQDKQCLLCVTVCGRVGISVEKAFVLRGPVILKPGHQDVWRHDDSCI